MTRKTAHYRGHVQGVGFRFTTQRIASDYEVTGYVRNLPDGRVELVAEGEPDQVDAFLEAVSQRMAGYIDDMQMNTEPARGEFRDFGIRY